MKTGGQRELGIMKRREQSVDSEQEVTGGGKREDVVSLEAELYVRLRKAVCGRLGDQVAQFKLAQCGDLWKDAMELKSRDM